MPSKKKTFAVIGLGEFGLALASELVNLGQDVIAIDSKEDNVERISSILDTVFVANATDEIALKELGIDEVDVAIVCIGENMEATILTTVLLKEFNVPTILVRVDDDYYIPIIKKLGATEVISPQRHAGHDFANRLVYEDYRDYYRLDDKYSIVSIVVNENREPIGIRNEFQSHNYGINVVLIVRDGKSFVPTGEDVIKGGDTIYVIGTGKDIHDFRNFINEGKKRRLQKASD